MLRSKHPGTLLVVLFLMLVMIVMSAAPSIASARIKPSPNSAPPACARVHTVNYAQYCVSPSVSVSPDCQGQQYFPATDQYGNPIDWTYTDLNRQCVTVKYNLLSSFSSCDIYFYVPAGNDATATFLYTWNDGSKTLQEAPVAGWQWLFSDSSATSLTFTDYDSPPGKRLGWGSSWQFSVKIFCA